MPEKLDDSTRTVLEAIEAAYNTGKGKPLDDRGRELLDPRPMAPPVGYNRQPSMVEHIRNMVRSEALRQAAEAAEADTFDEADDFDIEDDYDPHTPYEAVFDPPPPRPELPPHQQQPAPSPENKGTQPKAGETAPSVTPGPDGSGSNTPPAAAAG